MKNDISIECTVTAVSDHLAAQIFRRASRRLLNVNTWSNLDGSLAPALQLIDKDGKSVYRDVHPTDFLRIAENESDENECKWLKVERVEGIQGGDGTETVLLEARTLSSNPYQTDTSAARRPGIFRIVRKGLKITAGVYAEGDESGTVDHVVDKMKGLSRTAYATLGAYCVQWQSLVNAILGGSELTS